MAHARDEQCRIPPVFREAHARGFAGFPLTANPAPLVDPSTGRPTAAEASSHETILKRRVPNANKQATWAEMGFIERTAERMLGRLREARPTPRAA